MSAHQGEILGLGLGVGGHEGHEVHVEGPGAVNHLCPLEVEFFLHVECLPQKV